MTRLLVATALLSASCADLDGFLFKAEKVDRYRFDDYDGERQLPGALAHLGPLDPAHVSEHAITSGGETLAAVLLSPPGATLGPDDTLLVFFHGTSEHIDFYWPRVRLLYATGYPTLVVDYRGYGASTGTPTLGGLFADGAATLDFAREALGDPRVVVFANSLGTMVAVEAAARRLHEGRVQRFVLEAAMASIEAFVQDLAYLNLPASYLSSEDHDNTARIRDVPLPQLWLHGEEDEVLPINTHGWPLWRSYRKAHAELEAYRTVVPGAGHDTVPPELGFGTYVELLTAFVQGRQHAAMLAAGEE